MLALLAAAVLQKPADPLVTGFKNPPAWAKPHTWWHWMDGNITREGITADLEAMKQAGLGGAHIFDVGQGIPAGPVDYLSPQWLDLFQHAIREAKRLGLEMTVHNCAGWSSSGGPWVEPRDAMKMVVWSTVNFETAVTTKLPQRLPMPPNARGAYEDIGVFVFPATANAGPPPGQLTGMGPNPGPMEKLGWPVVKKDSIIAVPREKLGPDGTLDTLISPGKWTILRMGWTLTGSQNVASRKSGRGLEVDKLSTESLDRYFENGPKKYLDRIAGSQNALTTVLIDSYETGYNNWTPTLPSAFLAQNHYDMWPYLPALAGYAVDDDKTTLRFLYDYRQNLANLWTSSYSKHFADLLKARGLQLAIEPYGNGNFDPFTYAEPAGLIMGEYWVGEGQINGSVKHSSSIAHIYNHSVVGAEALTATPQQAGWRNEPRQWKPFADRAMTLGINRIIYHRFAHQPWVKGVLPGMTMGPWGSHVDRTNTFWKDFMPSWNEYLSRCQFMLQSGKFVGDVLLFTGESSPQSYAGEGQDLPEVPAGYDFDYIGAEPLMSLTVKDHRLVLPNGSSYAVLALPKSTKMSLRLARKIRQLGDAGAYVFGPEPSEVPGLAEVEQEAELKEVTKGGWLNPALRSSSLEQLLRKVLVAPDFRMEQGATPRDLRVIHRRTADRDIYFVASGRPYPSSFVGVFRDPGFDAKQVELWDPVTGQTKAAPVWTTLRYDFEPGQPFRHRVGLTRIPMRLEANGSVFVVISRKGPAAPHLELFNADVQSSAKPRPALKILKAEYGDFAGHKIVDVTKLVREAAGPFSVQIGATNTEMGGDPALNIVKKLRVTYTQGGVTKTIEIAENETLAIGEVPDASTPPDYELRSAKELWVWKAGRFDPNGSSRVTVGSLPPAQPLSGPWTATFPKGWDVPALVTFPKLTSWTDSKDFNLKHFSGTATYAKSFDLPAVKSDRWILDLGEVGEMCRVRLNGKLLATLWQPPFRVDITDAAHPKGNRLEVEVTNLWVNRLIGDEQFPDDMGWEGERLKGWPEWFVKHKPRPEPRRKTFTTWRHNTKDTPLMPSGLLGPVVLRPVKVVKLGGR